MQQVGDYAGRIRRLLRPARRDKQRTLGVMPDNQKTEPLVTYRGTVYPWHCDHMGHMNVMWYVGKFDEATWQMFHRTGMTSCYLRDANRGMAAVQQNITYIRELLAGDLVTVTSRILEIRDKVLRFSHEMANDATGEVAASCEMTGVHTDLGARRSCPFEPHIREKMACLLAG